MVQSQRGFTSTLRRLGIGAMVALVSTGVALLAVELSTLWIYPKVRGNTSTWADIDNRLHVANVEIELARGKSFAGKAMEAASEIHPYLGFAMDPRAELQQEDGSMFHPYSDLGFFMGGTLPPARGKNEFVVAISGGSVAAHFFNQGGFNQLKKLLRSIPALQSKRIIVKNYALPGFKQPQELMALNYLLVLGAQFDLWISINGFNDMVLPVYENEPAHVAMVYPRGWNLLTESVVEPAEAEFRSAIFTITAQREDWRAFATRPWLTRSAFVRAWWDIVDRRMEEKARELMKEIQAAQSRQIDRGPVSLDATGSGTDRLQRRALEIWEQSTRQMAKLCEANGIQYVVFVQPNQYFKDSKVLNAEEKQIAWAETGYRPYVEAGYPLLVESIPKLRAEGISVVDSTMIFRDEARTVYNDTCCHLNKLGNDLLGEHIAAEIVHLFDEKPEAAGSAQ